MLTQGQTHYRDCKVFFGNFLSLMFHQSSSTFQVVRFVSLLPWTQKRIINKDPSIYRLFRVCKKTLISINVSSDIKYMPLSNLQLSSTFYLCFQHYLRICMQVYCSETHCKAVLSRLDPKP